MARRDGDDPVWVGGCVGDVGRKEDSKVPVPLSLREANCREPERVLRECKPWDSLKRTAVTDTCERVCKSTTYAAEKHPKN